MGLSLISHTGVGVTATPYNDVTTSDIDTSGADLLIAGAIFFDSVLTRSDIIDSKPNSWNNLTESLISGNTVARLSWSRPTSVGTGHNFRYNSVNSSYVSLFIAAFSGANASPFDDEKGSTAPGSTSIQPGSLSPAVINELMVTVFGFTTSGTASIDSGFSITNQVDFLVGQHYGGGFAYKIKSDQAAENPTWSFPNGGELATRMASFKPSAILVPKRTKLFAFFP